MHGLLLRVVNVERQEVAALVWSFAYFFCLLCGYYILRPVRDEMGIQAGIDQLQWLFTATFVVMLAAVPIFGTLVARLPRRRPGRRWRGRWRRRCEPEGSAAPVPESWPCHPSAASSCP